MKKYILPVFFLIFLINVHAAFTQDYIVGEGDLLKISVYDNPDLTTVVRVSGDGFIAFPLLGNVKVAGLSADQIAGKITGLLANGYVVDPHVSVFVDEYQSRKTTILGQVEKPGVYVLSGNTSFLELLSKAGGLKSDAGDKAVINRKAGASGKEEKVITIDLRKLVAGGDTSLDVQIQDGDNIYVPKAGVFYITGEVKRPDSYKSEEGTTVIKAVTTAGGFTDKAASGRIRIIRRVGNKEEVLDRVGINEPVLPNDIVVVPESIF